MPRREHLREPRGATRRCHRRPPGVRSGRGPAPHAGHRAAARRAGGVRTPPCGSGRCRTCGADCRSGTARHSVRTRPRGWVAPHRGDASPAAHAPRSTSPDRRWKGSWRSLHGRRGGLSGGRERRAPERSAASRNRARWSLACSWREGYSRTTAAALASGTVFRGPGGRSLHRSPDPPDRAATAEPVVQLPAQDRRPGWPSAGRVTALGGTGPRGLCSERRRRAFRRPRHGGMPGTRGLVAVIARSSRFGLAKLLPAFFLGQRRGSGAAELTPDLHARGDHAHSLLAPC